MNDLKAALGRFILQCQEREAVRQKKIRVSRRKEAVGDEGEGNVRERHGKNRYGDITCGLYA